MIREKYYDIIDKPSNEVNRLWKVWHIFFILTGTISGLTASIIFSLVKQQFSEYCLLYPNISYTVNDSAEEPPKGLGNEQERHSVNIIADLVSTRWGDEWVCEYVQFVPLTSLILGSVFAAFFMMYPKGGTNFSITNSKATHAWHLVIPSMLVTFIFMIVVLSSLLSLTGGLSTFCNQFENLLKPGEKLSLVCDEVMYKIAVELKNFTKIPEKEDKSKEQIVFYVNPYTNMYFAALSLTICFLAWLGLFISLLLRVIYVADFKIIEVVVQKEEVNTYKPLEKSPTSAIDTDSAEEDTLIIEY